MPRNFRLSVLVVALAAGCPAARTSPATQSTIMAFDAAKSDEKALAIADQVMAAVGGEAAWAKVKQIKWSEQIVVNGQPIARYRHAWDRWNGRHQFTLLDAQDNENVAMYEIFSDVGSGMANGRPASRADTKAMIKQARERWAEDTYLLFMPMKLKDPGVHLKYVEERREEGQETAKYDVIQVTFDAGVGPHPGNVYFVVVDKETHLPAVVEWVPEGKPENFRLGYKWDKWVEVNGIKFATERRNLGADEAILFGDIEIGEPDDDLYIPQITG